MPPARPRPAAPAVAAVARGDAAPAGNAAARAARDRAHADDAREDARDDARDDAPPVAPLVARLDAAEEAGDVDARQLADLLGVTAGGLRAALAQPAALAAEQAAAVARALGVDAAAMRALRRAPASGAGGVSTDAPGPAPHGSPAPAPRSTLALLEAALGAVRGDADGLGLRAAVLDAAAAAARATGRPLPPGAHALRARLTRGDSDAPDASPGASADATSVLAVASSGAPNGMSHPVPVPGDDAPLVEAAAALVREIQRAAPGYDDLFAPLHDEALADLLRRHAVAVHEAAGVAAGTRLVLTPALYGRHRLVIPAAATADQRRLAARAALAHLLAGHAGDTAVLASPAPEPLARLADLVALADLVPFWQVGDARRRGRLGWRALAGHVAGEVARLAGDWSAARAADRGALRIALWRTTGL